MTFHLFPFEKIDRNSSVIIYGFGRVGMEYWKQLEISEYCRIVAFLDKYYLEKQENFQIPVFAPETINEFVYDNIVIAVENKKIRAEIFSYLVEVGVPNEKIVDSIKIIAHGMPSFSIVEKRRLADEYIHIAFQGNMGLGDMLIDCLFIKEFKKKAGSKVLIDYYGKSEDETCELPFLNKTYNLSRKPSEADYDMIVMSHRYWMIRYCNEDKIMRNCFLKKFFESIKEIESRGVFKNNRLFSQYALLLGKNRIEQTDIMNVLPLSRNAHGYIPWFDGSEKILEQYGLCNKKFIVFSRAVNDLYDNRNPKLWPLEYYNELVKKIKVKYPEMVLIQVGTRDKFGEIKNIDKNLKGKLSYGELCVILKCSELLISCEGGLVHLQHFLHGKSLVFYGPTSIEEFGYPENINLCNRKCPFDCMWLTEEWEMNCLKSKMPECMEQITPDMAFKGFEAGLKAIAGVVNFTYLSYDSIEEVIIWLEQHSYRRVGIIGEINNIWLDWIKEKTIYHFVNNDKLSDGFNGYVDYGHCFNLPINSKELDCIIVDRYVSEMEMIILEREMDRVLGEKGCFILKNCEYQKKEMQQRMEEDYEEQISGFCIGFR